MALKTYFYSKLIFSSLLKRITLHYLGISSLNNSLDMIWEAFPILYIAPSPWMTRGSSSYCLGFTTELQKSSGVRGRFSIMILDGVFSSAKMSMRRNGYSQLMSKITILTSLLWMKRRRRMLETMLLLPPPVKAKMPKW